MNNLIFYTPLDGLVKLSKFVFLQRICLSTRGIDLAYRAILSKEVPFYNFGFNTNREGFHKFSTA